MHRVWHLEVHANTRPRLGSAPLSIHESISEAYKTVVLGL